MITPSLATGAVLAVVLVTRELVRMSAARARWTRRHDVAIAVVTMVWLAFAVQRFLALRAGAA